MSVVPIVQSQGQNPRISYNFNSVLLAVLTSFVQARQRCFVPANRFYSVMCFFCPLCSQQALPQQLQRAAKGQQRGIRGRFYFVFIQ